MPHLHLSLQSGNDLILKELRRHQTSDAVKFCERIQKIRPNTVFGADMIVGFRQKQMTCIGVQCSILMTVI